MKKVLVFVLVFLLALSNLAFAENALVGRWECTGSVYAGIDMEPMGEWVEFKEDMTGTLFMLKEFPFTYSVDGDSVHIEQEYGLTFDGKLSGDELILDNGMEYHFARSGAAPAAADNTTTAVAQDTFTYDVIYLRIDNEPTDIGEEKVVFNSDGSGTFYGACYMNEGEEIPFAWERPSESEVAFVDGFDDYFLGTVLNDLLIGVHYVELSDGVHELAYVFRNTTGNGASMAPAFPQGAEILAQGGAYNALCCLSDGVYMECTGDGLQLNADGTGTVSFCGDVFDIDQWTQNGTEFSFIDQSGDTFEGVVVGGVIQGVYTISFSSGEVVEYEYIFNAAQ